MQSLGLSAGDACALLSILSVSVIADMTTKAWCDWVGGPRASVVEASLGGNLRKGNVSRGLPAETQPLSVHTFIFRMLQNCWRAAPTTLLGIPRQRGERRDEVGEGKEGKRTEQKWGKFGLLSLGGGSP